MEGLGGGSVSLSPSMKRKQNRGLPGGHCSTPITTGSTRRVRKNELKTHRGEPNYELGGVDGGNVGNELRYFRCADAVYGRVESCIFNSHAHKTYISGRPSCGGSPGSWYAIMSACIIRVKFLPSSRICSAETFRDYENMRDPTDVRA